MPCASPRYSASVASVIISGGTPTRTINSPFMKPRQTADEKRQDDGEGQRYTQPAPEHPEQNRAQSENRPDRQINPRRDNDVGHRQGDESDFAHESALVEEVARRQKVGVAAGKNGDDDDEENETKSPLDLVVPCGAVCRSRELGPRSRHQILCLRLRNRSIKTVTRMSTPCTA